MYGMLSVVGFSSRLLHSAVLAGGGCWVAHPLCPFVCGVCVKVVVMGCVCVCGGGGDSGKCSEGRKRRDRRRKSVPVPFTCKSMRVGG